MEKAEEQNHEKLMVQSQHPLHLWGRNTKVLVIKHEIGELTLSIYTFIGIVLLVRVLVTINDV